MNEIRHFFQLVDQRCVVQKLKEDANELTTEMIFYEILRIEFHTYKTNRLVSDCAYDFLFEMPWNVKIWPTVDLVKRIVRVNSTRKSIEAPRKTEGELPLLKWRT